MEKVARTVALGKAGDGEAGLNLFHIHSLHVGDETYHFAVEVSVLSAQLSEI
jgi:hypothetical protein